MRPDLQDVFLRAHDENLLLRLSIRRQHRVQTPGSNSVAQRVPVDQHPLGEVLTTALVGGQRLDDLVTPDALALAAMARAPLPLEYLFDRLVKAAHVARTWDRSRVRQMRNESRG